MKNDLFVTAGEVAQDLGVSKPFAYKLVRQMNEELEAKGFITIAGRVAENTMKKVLWYGAGELKGVRIWRRTKTNRWNMVCIFSLLRLDW